MLNDLANGGRSTSDGWRGMLAEDFTFANVRGIAAAVGRFFEVRTHKPGYRAIVGYDTRFMSRAFAGSICDILRRSASECVISDSVVPTPAISWFTQANGFDVGLAVTASHNPAEYNGIKIRMSHGGSPDAQTIEAIETHLATTPTYAERDGMSIPTADVLTSYVASLRRLIDLNAIDEAAPIVAVDSMHGTTGGILERVLEGTRAQVVAVRGNSDPLFGGSIPEPTMRSTDVLREAVVSGGFAAGFAHDGDGDRIIAIDPRVGYLSPGELGMILAFDLARRRGIVGAVAGTVVASRRLRALADLIGRDYVEVPIGFRHASEVMRSRPVLVAVEENGGIGVGQYIPDRDGTMAAALLLDAITAGQTSLGTLLGQIHHQVGTSVLLRRDIEVHEDLAGFVASVYPTLAELFGQKGCVEQFTADGIKIVLSTGDWVLLRPSGTQPFVRIYAEASDQRSCQVLLDTAVKVVRRNGSR